MLVMNVIAEILKKEGISSLFCFPTTPIIEAAAAVGIKPVICRQERVGVHMADGFSRVSNGRPPGVFAMQYGPGAENAFAGVANPLEQIEKRADLPARTGANAHFSLRRRQGCAAQHACEKDCLHDSRPDHMCSCSLEDRMRLFNDRSRDKVP